MTESFTLPQWLVDFWTVYGDMITPVLVTLTLAVITWVALSIKSSAKLNSAKADLQIQALKDVANREDNKPQLQEQTTKIDELEKAVMYLADMFNAAFQNSSLDPEIKNNLSALVNKIKYGTEEDLVQELENQKALLQEQINTLTEQLKNTTVVQEVTTEEKKRIRR